MSDEDVLVIQGVEYLMNPVGMRAMRRLLTMQQTVNPNRSEDEPITEAELDMAVELVTGAVRPEERDRLREHIEDSVGPQLLMQVATAVMGSFSDLDPTQPESSSGGSLPTGPASTDGALVAELTPSI